MSNPYQPFFDQLDKVLGDDSLQAEPRDLLQRAGFVLANLLNINAQVLPTLILPVEGEVEGPVLPDWETEDADSDLPGTT